MLAEKQQGLKQQHVRSTGGANGENKRIKYPTRIRRTNDDKSAAQPAKAVQIFYFRRIGTCFWASRR